MSKSLTQVPISNQPSKGIYPFNIAQTCNYATI
jgi:hypothetical protein